jgi:hypothetical protein
LDTRRNAELDSDIDMKGEVSEVVAKASSDTRSAGDKISESISSGMLSPMGILWIVGTEQELEEESRVQGPRQTSDKV